jgi:hypothetical protein
MNERESFAAADKKRKLIAAFPVCPVCGKNPSSQLAHRIGQTKANIAKHGKVVVHHRYNLVPVCGLECNGKVAIDYRPNDKWLLLVAIDLERDGRMVRAIETIEKSDLVAKDVIFR